METSRRIESLSQVEQLRKELVCKIIEITGLPVEDVEVDITLSNQKPHGFFVHEAQSLGWTPGDHDKTTWYTTELPQDGATVIFMEPSDANTD